MGIKFLMDSNPATVVGNAVQVDFCDVAVFPVKGKPF